jgi:hypothetical protein
MIKLGRVELYRMILQRFGDNPKYEDFNNDIEILKVIEFIKDMKNLMKMNILVLEGIENYFFNYQENRELDIIGITYKNNINIVIQSDTDILSKTDIKNLKEINFDSAKDYRYSFNKLINTLNSINNNYIKKHNTENKFHIKTNFYRILSSDKNFVFLSHAFDDKLYTFSLFVYFIINGVFLYVDWMWAEEFKNGQDIKTNLNNVLKHSNQLLFLRTVNSELAIKGSGNIRGWCSWELGAFYSSKDNNKNEKFYIEMYNLSGKQNKQMDGIKPLRDIINTKLV